MASPQKIRYKEQDEIDNYKQRVPYDLSKIIASYVNQQYFGDVGGKNIVEFGCGDGSMLRTFANRGASYCLGMDLSSTMITSGVIRDRPPEIDFRVKNCFDSITDHSLFGKFDFALCHFVLYYAKDEIQLKAALRNLFQLLKQGGKIFLGHGPQFAATGKDREIYSDLAGIELPLKHRLSGQDPIYVDMPAFRPSEKGRPFTREILFEFSNYRWSKEKVMSAMEEVGFVSVKLLPTDFPDGVGAEEKRMMMALEEPVMLIGAEKP